MCLGRNKPLLFGCTDADMVGDVDSQLSNSGFVVTFAIGVMS